MAQLHRYAIIRGTTVEGVTVWDGKSKWSPPAGTKAVRVKPEHHHLAHPGSTVDAKGNFSKTKQPKRKRE